MRQKRAEDSKTEISQLMLPEHANFRGTVNGGAILAMADGVAYVCAARHAGPNLVTVFVDKVEFHEPIRVGELVTFFACVNFVGKSSIEVGIEIIAEDLKSGIKRHTNSCYFTLVSLDDAGRPTEAPRLIPETDEEKKRFEEGRKRHDVAKSSMKK